MNAFRSDDGSVTDDCAYNICLRHTTEAMKKTGVNPYNTLSDYKRMRTEASFEIVESLEFKVPVVDRLISE